MRDNEERQTKTVVIAFGPDQAVFNLSGARARQLGDASEPASRYVALFKSLSRKAADYGGFPRPCPQFVFE